MSKPKALADLLQEYLPGSALAEGLHTQEVLGSWPGIVGEEIAKHSQAVGIENGILIVRVESSVWAQELNLLRPQIVRRLQERLGEELRDIRFHSRTRA